MESYTIEIHPWMRDRLQLRGARLSVYAIVYQICIRKGEYKGANAHISEILGINRLNVRRTLRALEKQGLIERRMEEVNGDQYPVYTLKWDPAEEER